MTQRLLAETVLSLSDAARLCPGDRPNHSTVYRWCMRGIIAADGRRHRLESIRIGGGQRVTSAQTLTRFFEAINAEAVAK